MKSNHDQDVRDEEALNKKKNEQECKEPVVSDEASLWKMLREVESAVQVHVGLSTIGFQTLFVGSNRVTGVSIQVPHQIE